MEFAKNGISIILNKNKHEADDIFFERGWFIVSQPKDQLNNFSELIKYSDIWINYKFLNCKYSKELTNNVINMSKNMLVNR